ncbi:MAG: hypothetical protein HZA92_18895 [Verrucomicrobia bacterium]|nr:hypothetical protein [Verrucomicrobiota bacterium]
MSTVVEIQAAIETLSFKERTELERWLRAGPAIPHEPSDLNPEEDTPELEAELLKAANSPLKPYCREEMQAVCDRILVEHRRK